MRGSVSQVASIWVAQHQIDYSYYLRLADPAEFAEIYPGRW